jgi:hypothetical protein
MMEQRVKLSRELLVTLRSAKHPSWTHFLTGDKSWFWPTIDHEQQWFPPGAERPTRPRKMISSPKAMVIIVWPPLGFPVTQTLPSKVTFTSKFFIDVILPHIVAAKPAGDPGRRWVLHIDSASPHHARLTARNLEENRIAASLHPVFSPDRAPSDVFLFGALKGQLSGHISESADKYVEVILEIASAIPQTSLERIFLEWKKDCSDVSISMVPMSTKVNNGTIHSLRFLL